MPRCHVTWHASLSRVGNKHQVMTVNIDYTPPARQWSMLQQVQAPMHAPAFTYNIWILSACCCINVRLCNQLGTVYKCRSCYVFTVSYADAIQGPVSCAPSCTQPCQAVQSCRPARLACCNSDMLQLRLEPERRCQPCQILISKEAECCALSDNKSAHAWRMRCESLQEMRSDSLPAAGVA